jgi:fatty acid amide hydrolase
MAFAPPLLLQAPTATEIATGIASGRLDPQEVLADHLRRAQRVDPVLNAVSWWVDDMGEERAADGALAGVPISVKDQFLLAGTPSTLGLEGRREHRAAVDGPLVARLRSAGAVPLVKGNVAQLLAYHEADNPLYGRTNNPWDVSRTPGGSSGGDAALVAAGAVSLAMTGDLAGSTRVPAHFCGICGFKPTRDSLTTEDTVDVGLRHVGITPQPGLLARTVADLTMAWETMSGSPRTKASALELPRLRVGWFDDNGWFAASPGVRRAVRQACDALRELGIEVVDFSPPGLSDAMRILLGLLGRDGSHYLRAAAGDRLDPRLDATIRVARMPRSLRRMISRTLRAGGQRTMSAIPTSLGPLTGQRRERLLHELDDLRAQHDAAWRSAGIDALICPPHALPALRHGQSGVLGPAVAGSYATLFNVTGHPAGVVPVTRVRRGEESDRGVGVDLATRAARRCERDSAGLPVGVQVVGPHGREDLALAVMAALEDRLVQHGEHPSRAERLPPCRPVLDPGGA